MGHFSPLRVGLQLAFPPNESALSISVDPRFRFDNHEAHFGFHRGKAQLEFVGICHGFQPCMRIVVRMKNTARMRIVARVGLSYSMSFRWSHQFSLTSSFRVCNPTPIKTTLSSISHIISVIVLIDFKESHTTWDLFCVWTLPKQERFLVPVFGDDFGELCQI